MTNDGATILKAIGVDNPAAKVLVGEITALYMHLSFTGVYIIPVHADGSLAMVFTLMY